MLWPLTRRRHVTNPQLAQRIDAVRNQNPESERWLMLVKLRLPRPMKIRRGGRRAHRRNRASNSRSLLHQSQIAVRRRVLHRWVREVLDLAATDRSREPVELLEAALCQDDSRLETPELRVVAQMAALPLLQTCGRALKDQVSASWWEGYCPVCGAWPTLAEFRGLERKRWLRCGRCATGWEMPWLRCPFCGETEHTNLGYLAPEEGETTRKVEVCDSCKGYVKAEPTVKHLAPWEIVLDDLATVPLEVAALDRGYHRPERPGFALEARIVEA